MGQDSELKSPKKEEQFVRDSLIPEFFESNTDNLSDFKGISDITDNMNQGEGVMSSTNDELNWDHLIEWHEFSINDDDQDSGVCDQHVSQNREGNTNMVNVTGNVKVEFCQVWKEKELQDQEDDKNACLNLSLNFQKVMDAWSNRGPCWTDEFAQSTSNEYMGEVPAMDEARTKREASVLKYKEKRNNRMFSRKIRYQVRKLNADKRPRLKGRFVKRES